MLLHVLFFFADLYSPFLCAFDCLSRYIHVMRVFIEANMLEWLP